MATSSEIAEKLSGFFEHVLTFLNVQTWAGARRRSPADLRKKYLFTVHGTFLSTFTDTGHDSPNFDSYCF